MIIRNREGAVIHETQGYADLRSADLQGADLQGADLQGANLQDANLRYADLRSAHLYGADLRYANLRSADLQGADLQGADLRYANLQDANLRSADLRNANLRYANLPGADLQGAILPDGRTLPDYLAWLPAGLLTQGGKSLETVVASWDSHKWTDCPMHCAFDADSLDAVPACWRSAAALFVALFDGRHLPKPEVAA